MPIEPGLVLEHVRAHLGWCVGTYFPTWNCHRGSPGWLKTAPKCHKLGICSHKQSRRFHMSTVTCVKAGTCQGTPGLMCWDLFPHLELPLGVSRMVSKHYGLWGHFGPFRSPRMALPDGFKGSNTSIWMYPT